MTTAILVVDMLQDYFLEGHLSAVRSRLCADVNRLTGMARDAGLPVVWVRQEFLPDLSDAFPVMRKERIRITIAGTPGSALLPELQHEGRDLEIVKKRYSAFFGTGLSRLLEARGVGAVVVAGVNTHACVRTTAIDAYQRDLAVVIPQECVASHDRNHHEVTLRYLGRHIARVISLDQLAAEW